MHNHHPRKLWPLSPCCSCSEVTYAKWNPPNGTCCRQVVVIKSRSLGDANLFQNLNYSYAKWLKRKRLQAHNFRPYHSAPYWRVKAAMLTKQCPNNSKNLKQKFSSTLPPLLRGKIANSKLFKSMHVNLWKRPKIVKVSVVSCCFVGQGDKGFRPSSKRLENLRLFTLLPLYLSPVWPEIAAVMKSV